MKTAKFIQFALLLVQEASAEALVLFGSKQSCLA